MIACRLFTFPVPRPGPRLRLSKPTISVHLADFFFASECSTKCSQGLRFLFAHLPDVLRGTSSLCLSVPRPGIEPRIRRPKRRVISVSPSGRVCHSTTKRAETRAYVLICSCEASAGRKLVRAYGTVLRFGNAVPYSQRSLDSLKWIAASRVRIVSRRGMRSRPHYRYRTEGLGHHHQCDTRANPGRISRLFL